jgi:alanyl-tRNA synthetase
MTQPSSSPVSRVADSTRVTFPGGATSGTSRVLASGSWGLIVEETPFRPFNSLWPGQPADTGSVEIGGRSMSVVDCVVGAVEFGSGRLIIGGDIPVSHGAGGWYWVVVHVLDGDPNAVAGSGVTLRVDPGRRHDLSAAHTARHLSGLALNAALASLWSFGMPPDSLGHPNFDALALSSSAITTTGFRDTYRIRTWSSQGDGEFDAEHLDDLVTILGLAVTDRIQRWLARQAPIRLVAAGPYLADHRSWEWDLVQGTVRIACDGIHPVDLGVIADTHVTATLTRARTELTLAGEVTATALGARPRTRPSRAARHNHTVLKAIRH